MNIDTATGELKEINILETMDGALAGQIDREIAKVIKNCVDPDIDYKKSRRVTITLTFKPNEARSNISMKSSVTSYLVSANPMHCSLSVLGTKDEPIAMEYVPQIPGQCAFMGTEQESPKIISMVV